MTTKTTIKRFALLCLILNNFIYVEAQKDYTRYVKPVHDRKESTALSIYDANPESPDGKHLCYIRYPMIVQGGHSGTPVKADVILKNLNTGNSRKISEVTCTNHNGANAIWINDSLISFMVNHLQGFAIYNINSDQSVFGLVKGELGHKSFGNILIYTKCNKRLLGPDKKRIPFNTEEEGIHALNCKTGETNQIAKKIDIIKAFRTQNPNVTKNEAQILHVEPNPNNDKIMFDYRHPRYPDKRWEELHGFLLADGSGIRWVKERPMHVVWFDNNSMFGVDTKDPERKIYRYDLYGKKLEMLGGTSTHVGTSPDRKLYIGESAYYKPEEDGFTRVYLYNRGEKEPYALLAEWQNTKITWEWVAHVDPSFSNDGERAYFIRASSTEDIFEAVFINFTEIK